MATRFFMFFAENRKAPAGAMTDADRIDLFKTMLVAGGTYKVEGNKFFFQGDVSASQTVSKFTYEFEITGSKLKMTAGPFKILQAAPTPLWLPPTTELSRFRWPESLITAPNFV